MCELKLMQIVAPMFILFYKKIFLSSKIMNLLKPPTVDAEALSMSKTRPAKLLGARNKGAMEMSQDVATW